MKLKLLLQVISVILAVKAAFGVVYILMGWSATIVGWVVPAWLVVVAVIVDAYLAYLAYKYSKKKEI